MRRTLTVFEKRSLDFSSREAVARYVDDVIDTTPDPVVPFVVTTSAVTGELRDC